MLGVNLIGYIIFAFITSITPGPNNLLLFIFGKNYGFNKSIPIMFGIFLGFSTMLYISAYGIAEIISSNTILFHSLKIVSSIWLLYLAVYIRKFEISNVEKKSISISFFSAFLMQFVNPKAWIMALTASTAFMPQSFSIHINVLIFTSIFGIVGIMCMVCWVIFGDIMSKYFTTESANTFLGNILCFLMLVSIGMVWI